MFKHLKFTAILVKDQERALRFYVDKLGFVLKKNEAYGQERWVEISLPDAETYFLLEKDPERLQLSLGKPSLTLITDDVVATYKVLISRDVEFTQEPTKQSWGEGMYALFADSEGNIVLISDS